MNATLGPEISKCDDKPAVYSRPSPRSKTSTGKTRMKVSRWGNWIVQKVFFQDILLRYLQYAVKQLRNLYLFIQVKKKCQNVIYANAVSYCETTSIHGFAYWISADNLAEKLFWFIVVCIGFSCSGLIISSAVRGWREHPGVTVIKTFSKVPSLF